MRIEEIKTAIERLPGRELRGRGRYVANLIML